MDTLQTKTQQELQKQNHKTSNYQKSLNSLTRDVDQQRTWKAKLVHGQVTIIFVVSVCLIVQSFSQPSLIRFRSN